MKIAYFCSKCSAENIKLWRQYQTCADNIDLLCGPCALDDQLELGPIDSDGYIIGKYGKSDQIGVLVPAIPDKTRETFWGYISAPMDLVAWWRNLPTYAQGGE